MDEHRQRGIVVVPALTPLGDPPTQPDNPLHRRVAASQGQLHLRLAHEFPQPIGAHQEAVAVIQLDRRVDYGRPRRSWIPDDAQEPVPVGVAADFFGLSLTRIHQCLDYGMIEGTGHEAPVAEHIQPRVPDVPPAHPWAIGYRHDQGGTHVVEFLLPLLGRDHSIVGRPDIPFEIRRVDPRFFPKPVEGGLDRDGRSGATAGVSTEPIRHDPGTPSAIDGRAYGILVLRPPALAGKVRRVVAEPGEGHYRSRTSNVAPASPR